MDELQSLEEYLDQEFGVYGLSMEQLSTAWARATALLHSIKALMMGEYSPEILGKYLRHIFETYDPDIY